MRYLVNMVYKCKGKSYLTYEVEAESEDEAIELARVGSVIVQMNILMMFN